jgi:hypothetical protein
VSCTSGRSRGRDQIRKSPSPLVLGGKGGVLAAAGLLEERHRRHMDNGKEGWRVQAERGRGTALLIPLGHGGRGKAARTPALDEPRQTQASFA